MRLRFIFVLALLTLTAPARSDLMTVADLKYFISQGEVGEVAATSYVQGVVDGMLAVDSIHHRDEGLPYEFCKLQERGENQPAPQHPAVYTKSLVAMWEAEGNSMDTLAVDMILAFLDARYACD